MAMETDPSKINDAERQLETSVFSEGQGYAARNARSKEENKGRAAARSRIKDLGMEPNAFATAVAKVKSLTPTQLDDWLRDFNFALGVLRQKQAELFPEELAAALKRESIKAAKSGPVVPPASATDDNPRSDPNAGGAKPQTSESWPDDAAVAERNAAEQDEGDAALNAALPETKSGGKKKSQSQLAREAAEAAGTTH